MKKFKFKLGDRVELKNDSTRLAGGKPVYVVTDAFKEEGVISYFIQTTRQ